MNAAFRSANVSNYGQFIQSVTLPDENDRHVVAAAIKGKADVIVTFNLKDFPSNELSPLNIEVVHPDKFILNVIDLDESAAGVCFEKMVNRLKNPPLTATDVLSALEKTGIERGSARLRKLVM